MFLLTKSQKTLNAGKIRKYDEETVFFRKKSFHLFKSLLCKKGHGAKHAGGSRPSCLISVLITCRINARHVLSPR